MSLGITSLHGSARLWRGRDDHQPRDYRGCHHHQHPEVDEASPEGRDAELRQTKKENQWYFGMKAHIWGDSHSKLVHSVAATQANVHDSQALPNLLPGKEARVWGDSPCSAMLPRRRASSRPKPLAIGR